MIKYIQNIQKKLIPNVKVENNNDKERAGAWLVARRLILLIISNAKSLKTRQKVRYQGGNARTAITQKPQPFISKEKQKGHFISE